jgi:TonB family protein
LLPQTAGTIPQDEESKLKETYVWARSLQAGLQLWAIWIAGGSAMKFCAAALFLLITMLSLMQAQVVLDRVRVAPGVIAGLIENKVDPVYPPLARQARIQGAVILGVIISKTGDVENLQLISGHPMLAPAAIEAVKQWKYKPYLLNGEPVEVETQVQVNFRLSEKPASDGIAQSIPSEPGSLISMPQDASVPQRVRVSSGVAQGLLIKKVNPEYPPEAKDEQIQGVVLLQVIIDKEGNVANIKLISGHPALAPAAMEAVAQWRYRPYLLNGSPVEVETQVRVNFTLAQ